MTVNGPGVKNPTPNAISPASDVENLLLAFCHELVQAVVIIELDSRCVLYCNRSAEAAFEYADREMLRQTAEPLFTGDWGVVFSQIEKNGFWHGSLEYRRRDGSRFTGRTTAMLLQTDQSRYATLIVNPATDREEKAASASARDFTPEAVEPRITAADDRHTDKLLEALKEKEHMAAIGTATAMLAHEIKNPLNGMSTTVQLLERSLRNDMEIKKETLVETIRDLKTETVRLQTLLEDFQAISHPQRVTFQRIDLRALMHEVVTIGVPGSLREKVKVVEEFAPDLPRIQGDANKLKQAFLNLVKNSCEAMQEGGVLTVKAYADEEGVSLDIIDTGEGIPPDLDVFQLFSSTKSDGTGLGLVIVRQIILAHNGAIYFSSQPNRKTAFRVILPV